MKSKHLKSFKRLDTILHSLGDAYNALEGGHKYVPLSIRSMRVALQITSGYLSLVWQVIDLYGDLSNINFEIPKNLTLFALFSDLYNRNVGAILGAPPVTCLYTLEVIGCCCSCMDQLLFSFMLFALFAHVHIAVW